MLVIHTAHGLLFKEICHEIWWTGRAFQTASNDRRGNAKPLYRHIYLCFKENWNVLDFIPVRGEWEGISFEVRWDLVACWLTATAQAEWIVQSIYDQILYSPPPLMQPCWKRTHQIQWGWGWGWSRRLWERGFKSPFLSLMSSVQQQLVQAWGGKGAGSFAEIEDWIWCAPSPLNTPSASLQGILLSHSSSLPHSLLHSSPVSPTLCPILPHPLQPPTLAITCSDNWAERTAMWSN